MRPALTLCLLWQALWPRPGRGEHPTADRAGCSAAGACYSLHHAGIKRPAAQEACSLRGGALSTVRGGAELREVLALLRAGPGPGGGSRDLLFWVALERRPSECTLEGEPLRGFSWVSPDVDDVDVDGPENETLPWVLEPQRSCVVRACAALQAAEGAEPAGWRELRCHLRAHGYLCKYRFEGLCPAPRPGAASALSFRAPFQLHSAALAFSPPGTEVSARCPGRPPAAATATCIVDGAGARWDGMPPGAALCPCPGRYLRAGRCAELSDCLDDLEGFVCECAAGFLLGRDRRSCVTYGGEQPDPGATMVPARPPLATAASPTPRRTWSPRVPDKPGEMPQVPGQGNSATFISEIPGWAAKSTLPTLQMSPQANSEATVTSSGSVIPTSNSTSSSASPRGLDSSSTVVFILVSIAVVVLVILTMTVLGLFKLCFHKSPSSRPGKGPLAAPAVESGAQATALSSSSANCATGEVQAAKQSRWRLTDGSSLDSEVT